MLTYQLKGLSFGNARLDMEMVEYSAKPTSLTLAMR